jgi:hypothetical protein
VTREKRRKRDRERLRERGKGREEINEGKRVGRG